MLLYLEFGSDKVGDQPRAAINDRELAGVCRGSKRTSDDGQILYP